MLKDKTTNKTYSGRTDAINQLGKQAFNRKVKNNEIDYIKTFY